MAVREIGRRVSRRAARVARKCEKSMLRCAQHERVLQQQARQLSDAYQVAMRIGSDLAAAHVEAGAEAE